MTFYLGSDIPGWVKRAGVPLFLSRRRLARQKAIPAAIAPWALDSGGFSELSMHGTWAAVPPGQYAREVIAWRQQIGRLEWAAVQDWMCEPWILEKTGKTIPEHQALTIRSYQDLADLAPDVPWAPVLQGFDPDDYLRHVDAYDRAGIDLTRLPIVGIGSVCRRQDTAPVAGLIWRLAGMGIRLHGFGFKLSGLPAVAGALASADSMSWSFQARRQRVRLSECTHRAKICSACLAWALLWRSRALEAIQAGAAGGQAELFGTDEIYASARAVGRRHRLRIRPPAADPAAPVLFAG